jgi:hypothetical protein
MTDIVAGLNSAASALGRAVFAPIALLPGWLSVTLVGAATGVLMLMAFKYTSNQSAIKRVRNGIKADLLALSLFKENVAVSLRAQGRIFAGAARLLALAVVPTLVMIVPMSLLLGQLALWYQARPLAVGEETVVTLTLAGGVDSPWPDARLEAAPAFEPVLGPVRIASQRQLCWDIRGRENGYHRLVFRVEDRDIDKEFAVGEGFMRVSLARPAWIWWEALLHPAEHPFRPDSPVRSIEIAYPARSSWTSGSNSWIVYWFLVSMLSAFACRRTFNVSL